VATSVQNAAVEDGSGCPIEAALKRLPQMTLAVGEQKVCCPDAAEKLSGQTGVPIRFLVGEKSYTDRSQATLALAEATEKFVNAYVEPTVCQETGATTVAGTQHCCNVAAGKVAQLAKEAMAKVQMTYLVGDVQCDCPDKAKQMAEQTGATTQFVVGNEKTACSVTARLNLARAKYRAAVEAVVQSQAQQPQQQQVQQTQQTQQDTQGS
jgi:hypothetical protein